MLLLTHEYCTQCIVETVEKCIENSRECNVHVHVDVHVHSMRRLESVERVHLPAEGAVVERVEHGAHVVDFECERAVDAVLEDDRPALHLVEWRALLPVLNRAAHLKNERRERDLGHLPVRPSACVQVRGPRVEPADTVRVQFYFENNKEYNTLHTIADGLNRDFKSERNLKHSALSQVDVTRAMQLQQVSASVAAIPDHEVREALKPVVLIAEKARLVCRREEAHVAGLSDIASARDTRAVVAAKKSGSGAASADEFDTRVAFVPIRVAQSLPLSELLVGELAEVGVGQIHVVVVSFNSFDVAAKRSKISRDMSSSKFKFCWQMSNNIHSPYAKRSSVWL